MSSTKPYNIPLTINKLLLECFQSVDGNLIKPRESKMHELTKLDYSTHHIIQNLHLNKFKNENLKSRSR